MPIPGRPCAACAPGQKDRNGKAARAPARRDHDILPIDRHANRQAADPNRTGTGHSGEHDRRIAPRAASFSLLNFS